MTADGTPMPGAGVGPLVTSHFSLPDVFHIPKLTLNLASVGRDSGYLITFSSSYVQD
jgi:hypothetical protein